MNYMLSKHFVELELFKLKELRFWEKMTLVPGTVGEGLFLLLVRDFAPLEQRLTSIASRLEQVPGYELEYRETLSFPVRLWNGIQAESASRLFDLFNILKSVALNSKLPGSDKDEILELSERAFESIKSHREWLLNEIIPKGLLTLP